LQKDHQAFMTTLRQEIDISTPGDLLAWDASWSHPLKGMLFLSSNFEFLVIQIG